LAAAGLARLDESRKVTQFLDPTTFIPSIGQGTLAVEVRSDRADLIELMHAIQDPDAVTVAAAERAFSAAIGGGCKMPIGCFARIESGMVTLHAVIAGTAGQIHFDGASGPRERAAELASDLAQRMKSNCGFDLTFTR
jgi:hydroxymethylbilane synthase